MKLVHSLTYRSFALLWAGQTISRLGDSLYRIALAWWVLEKTGSATAMGTVLIFSTVPMLLFLLIGGVAVDRFSRLYVMLLSDLGRGLVVIVITLLAFSQRLEVWHVYLASVLFGFANAFFHPAYTAVVPEVVPGEALTSANSLTSLSNQLSNIAGPALGAAMIALGGTSLAFGLDAFSFFISAACLIIIPRLPLPPAPTAHHANMLQDLRAGIKIVFDIPWLWITIAIFSLVNITVSGPMSVALPFLVKENLTGNVGGLGLLYSMTSAGSVLGALILGQFKKLRRRGWLAYGATAATGLLIFLLGWPITIVGAAAAVFLYGASLSVFSLIWTVTLQEMVPRPVLGRVSSIDALGSFVLLPIGYALAGWATDATSAPAVFMLGGVLTILLAFAGLAHPAVRHLD